MFTGCEDKKPDQSTIPDEKRTSVTIQKKESQDVIDSKNTSPVSPNTSEQIADNVFTFHNMDKTTYTATLTEKNMQLQNSTKPIVLLQFFATWCAPCVGEIAYLKDLQEAYKKDLFAAGILIRDEIDDTALNAFIAEHGITYEILQQSGRKDIALHIAKELDIQGTLPIPLIILYLNGKYYTHYEGSVPVEMVKYDIEQAKKQLKK